MVFPPPPNPSSTRGRRIPNAHWRICTTRWQCRPTFAPRTRLTTAPCWPPTASRPKLTTWRTIGGTEMGAWIESPDAPFFAIGTNLIARAYVSASGAVSFESTRRPPVGQSLPDGTGLPVLCPLRTPLGFVPEANWLQLVGQDLQDYQDLPATNNPANPVNPVEKSRFWHDALPGGGRVLTWKNALVDGVSGDDQASVKPLIIDRVADMTIVTLPVIPRVRAWIPCIWIDNVTRKKIFTCWY